MCRHRIVGKTVAASFELKHGFAGFEKHLDIPSFAVDTKDLFFGKLGIGTDQSELVFSVGAVS